MLKLWIKLPVLASRLFGQLNFPSILSQILSLSEKDQIPTHTYSTLQINKTSTSFPVLSLASLPFGIVVWQVVFNNLGSESPWFLSVLISKLFDACLHKSNHGLSNSICAMVESFSFLSPHSSFFFAQDGNLIAAMMLESKGTKLSCQALHLRVFKTRPTTDIWD